MQEIQESVHGAGFKYEAPHLRHPQLVDLLSELTLNIIRDAKTEGLPLTLLEIGAGHGGYTRLALAAGCSVTATEMSRESIRVLDHQLGTNPALRTVFEADGSLAALGDERYSIILCSSVLHHIPDYLAFITGPLFAHLAPGGTLLAFQDPLWYPRVGAVNHWADRAAYLTYRLPRGHYRRGLSALGRRMTGRLDESNPSDMSEYHVMRQGVDERAIEAALSATFDSVEVMPYWSTLIRSLQRAGDRLGLRNTFAVRASGFAGSRAAARTSAD